MPLLLPFARYIRSIETPRYYFPFSGLSSIQPLFQVPLPALECVELATEGGRLFDLGLSRELHPRLRKLEIHRFVVSPLPLCLSTLQDLAINLRDLRKSTWAALTPECLVNVLAHSPQLVSLKLYFSPLWSHYYPPDCPIGADRPENLGPPTYTGRCRLPHLWAIDFHCPYLFASSVLTELDAPAVTFFHLTVASRFVAEPSEIADRIFPPSLRNTADGKMALFVEFMGDHCFGIRDFEPRPMIQWHEKDPRNQLSFHYFDLTNTLHPLDAALSTLCTAFPNTSLQSLKVFGFTAPPTGAVDGAWVPLFTAFPTLSSLMLNNHPEVVYSFLSTLSPLTTQSPTVPWPALRSLHIDTDRCSCDGIYNPCGPINSDTAHILFERVLEAVRARAERGVPLAKFRFEPSVRRLCGVAAHRWILYSVSLLCGEFELHSWDHERVYDRSGLWDLFSASERRRLSEKRQDSEAAATDGTSTDLDAKKITEFAESSNLEDGGSEVTGVPEEYVIMQDSGILFRRPTAPLIHSLPVELVSEIFTIVACMARQTVTPAAWMQLLLVCKVWKRIACDIAELWRVIYVNSNPDWLRLCLDRAARSLIDLHLANVSARDVQATKQLILPHQDRIRAIRINDSHHRLTASIAELFTIGLTALEELSFIPVEWRVKRETSFGLSPQAFPWIRSLTLSGISLPRDPTFYSNIRYLELHEQCCKGNGFTIRHLFDALRAASHSLEDLDLSRFDPIQEDRPVGVAIVRPLLIPPRIHLRLRIVLAEGEAMEHQTTERLLGAMVPPNIRAALDQAEELAVLVERERFRVCVLDRTLSSESSSPEFRDQGILRSERVRVELFGPYFPAEALRAVPIVCAAPLTTLCINSVDIQHDISDWRLALGAFPLLQNLVLHGREVGWIRSIGIPFTALTKEADANLGLPPAAAGSKGGARCPLLKAVRVEGLSSGALLDGQEAHRFLGVVAGCLHSRQGHARKLDTLAFRSFLRDVDYEELEGLVDKVEIFL
ncbi:hypothetical protein GSI_14412 [Ganoderma sinense ZZ0214-1]|uniref:F-box domain-containing protein n=1 Tax=Ganoderma sinense ZZ0214-1 TaxID=1077348 RepID=A0A2G8RNL0_9APHY|nr:hypothetical protein GSI_14412 [Ganoderma sinense ZZ0214-1]